MTALGVPSPPVSRRPSASLLDAVDRIVDQGVVLSGDLVLSIADVDLVVVDLRLLVCAVETIEQADLLQHGPRAARPRARAARVGLRRPSGPEGVDGCVQTPSVAAQGMVSTPRVIGPDRESDQARGFEAQGIHFPGPKGGACPPEPLRFDVASPVASFAPARNQPPAERADWDPESAGRSVAKLALTLIEFLRRLLERQAIRRMEGGLVDDEAIERLGLTLGCLEDRVQELKRVFKLEGESLDLDLGPLGRLNGPAEAGA